MFDEGWTNFFNEEIQKDYFKGLGAGIHNLRQAGVEVYPPEGTIFNAFKLTPFKDLKVVILGQDPYHGAGQAHGLAFSVPEGVTLPPSLNNIFKELNRDLNVPIPDSGDLTEWAEGGILLLNTVLTVEKGQAGSHRNRGWETFTDNVIRYINENKVGVVFALWGTEAQQKSLLVDSNKHTILKTSHPSPFSAHKGFLGSGHFRKINEKCHLWEQK